ncbi:MAG TPA: homoserine kinase [Polyangiaceae bacterium]
MTQLPVDDARALGRAYGVVVESVEALELGSVNSNFRIRTDDGTVLFGRLYEEQGEDGARGELELVRALAAAGVPVAAPLPVVGKAQPAHAGKPFALFPWLESEILCQGRVTTEHCRSVGSALAKVHLASPFLPRLGAGRFGPEHLLVRLERVKASGRSEFFADAELIRESIERYRAARDPALPSGVVHGDLFRDNVLGKLGGGAGALPTSETAAPPTHETGALLALLDFESAFHGPFLYDVLVTMAAWCFRDAFDLELARALGAGYQAERPLEAGEKRALRVEGALGMLRFATTRITDYSLRVPKGAKPVRDYRRFLARLSFIEAGALDGVFG